MPSIYVFKRKRQGKPEKVYSAQIRFSGKQGGASFLRSTGVTDRREAEAAARRIAREIEERELPRRGAEILTVEAMFSRWIEEHGKDLRSGKDLKWQLQLLLRLLGGTRPVRDIGNKDIHALVQDAKLENASPATINRTLAVLRSTMKFAAEMWEEPVKAISWKKMLLTENKRRTVYLSPEEARLMMGLMPYRIALGMAFALYTGMRLGEMDTLIWPRIDLDRGVAMVLTKAKGKAPVMRPVWLSEKAIAILKSLDRTGDKVFDLTNRRGYWEAAREQIGRPDVRWHDLRAMTATWARQYAGKDITLISHALGHAGTKVTERYARVVDREIVTMLDQLPDVTPQATPQNRLAKLLSNDEDRGDTKNKSE